MVTPVGNTVPYSYYNVLNPNGPKPLSAPPAASATPPAQTAPAPSKLPEFNPATDILALLQATGSVKNNGLSALFGFEQENNGLDALLGFNSSTTGNSLSDTLALLLKNSYQQALKPATPNESAVQGVLAAYQKAINAYTATSSAQTQSVIDANSFQADGKTKLVI